MEQCVAGELQFPCEAAFYQLWTNLTAWPNSPNGRLLSDGNAVPPRVAVHSTETTTAAVEPHVFPPRCSAARRQLGWRVVERWRNFRVTKLDVSQAEGGRRQGALLSSSSVDRENGRLQNTWRENSNRVLSPDSWPGFSASHRGKAAGRAGDWARRRNTIGGRGRGQGGRSTAITGTMQARRR